jgi:hypothetical protein
MQVDFSEPGALKVVGYRLNKVSTTAKAKPLEEGGLRTMAKFLSNLPSGMMFKKPMNPAAAQHTAGFDATLYAPQSRLEVFWRTLVTDQFRGEHPAPDACGQAYKISCRRYLSSLSASMHTNISSVEDFTSKWNDVLEENNAFENMLLPGEMKSLVRRDRIIAFGPLFADTNI